MVGSISATEKNLGKVFCMDYAFRIPPYQRPYAWGPEQAEELLDDLIGAMGTEADGPVPKQAPYFLGSIVLIKAPGEPEADVVDGQQRLTTLTILFALLRDLERNETEKAEGDKLVLERGSALQGTSERFRLAVRDRDAPVFRDHVQRTTDTEAPHRLSDAQANVLGNRDALRSRLKVLPEAERRRLGAFAVQRCFLVVVAASDRDSAYRVFSVLNNRGLDLTPTDILKADIIGAVPEDRQDAHTERWDGLEDELGRKRFTELFSHLRMMYLKQKAKGSLEKEFREAASPTVNPEGFVDGVLTPCAHHFLRLDEQAYEGESYARVNGLLRGLADLDNRDWMPPAISFAYRRGDDPAALEGFLGDLDRLAYSMFIRRLTVTSRLRRYGAVLTAIKSGEALHGEGLLGLTEEERRQTLQRLDGPVYTVPRIAKPVLKRLDQALSDGSATYATGIVTVEHVLPQRPKQGSEWLRLFPDEEERRAWTHRLGNLVLLSRTKNASAGNYEFSRKKDAYFLKNKACPFVVTSRLASVPEWTPDVLKGRQEEAVATLRTLWSL